MDRGPGRHRQDDPPRRGLPDGRRTRIRERRCRPVASAGPSRHQRLRDRLGNLLRWGCLFIPLLALLANRRNPEPLGAAAASRNGYRCAKLISMPIATAEKITALSHDLGSQRHLAELLGVSPAQITRWRRGGGIDLANAERVDLLELVLASLLRLYPAEAAEQWLQALNPHLGDRRPIDLVRAGRAQELLGAIAVERSGGYA